MNRRSLLKALPIVAVMPAVAAVPALADAETPVSAGYRRYLIARDALANAPVSNTDEEDQPLYDAMNAIEDEMMALPSMTPRDMAIKMVVGHHFGDMSGLDYDGMIWAEARALIGGAA